MCLVDQIWNNPVCVYLQGMEKLTQPVASTLVLFGVHREHSLSPELPEHFNGAIDALRIKVVDRVEPGRTQKVHVGIRGYHLPHCSPKAATKSDLGTKAMWLLSLQMTVHRAATWLTLHRELTLSSAGCFMVLLRTSSVTLRMVFSVMNWCVWESQDRVTTWDQKLGRKPLHGEVRIRRHSGLNQNNLLWLPSPVPLFDDIMHQRGSHILHTQTERVHF